MTTFPPPPRKLTKPTKPTIEAHREHCGMHSNQQYRTVKVFTVKEVAYVADLIATHTAFKGITNEGILVRFEECREVFEFGSTEDEPFVVGEQVIVREVNGNTVDPGDSVDSLPVVCYREDMPS